jgi:5-hydroxyisourate hydrolase
MGISTHVLDTSLGRPAAAVGVVLSRFRATPGGGNWQEAGKGATDQDGRCRDLLGAASLEVAVYKVTFEVGAYFEGMGVATLYPFIEITFQVVDSAQHYHIPLLVTANGYITYRGS